MVGPSESAKTSERTSTYNALLDYQEVRVGGGIKLKLLDNLSVETAAGSTVYRKFDYFRFGQQTSPQNAPYIQTSVKFSF